MSQLVDAGVAASTGDRERYAAARTAVSSFGTDRTEYSPVALSDESRGPYLRGACVVIVRTAEGRVTKCFWRERGWSRAIAGVGGMLRMYLEAAEDQIGEPEDTVATVSPWPLLWIHPEAEPEVFQGIFAPERQRRILFTQKLEIRTRDLRRREPTIIVNRRTLSMVSDD